MDQFEMYKEFGISRNVYDFCWHKIFAGIIFEYMLSRLNWLISSRVNALSTEKFPILTLLSDDKYAPHPNFVPISFARALIYVPLLQFTKKEILSLEKFSIFKSYIVINCGCRSIFCPLRAS